MPLESATYISDLNASNPLATDGVSVGDDHIRLIKNVAKITFPNVSGAVTPTHTVLNYMLGVTSAVQTQIDSKVARSGINILDLVSKSANYTLVLADLGVFHPGSDTTARTMTIDSNANVAYPLYTCLTFVNQNAAGVMTIAITSDTMRWAGGGATGSRALAANGIATAIKVLSTEWIISGTGLS